MNLADIKEYDIANGKGVRLSIFVSGCPHHCKNCFNEETWDFNYGYPYTEQTKNKIIKILQTHENIYDGVTILGGEPLCPENITTVANIISAIRQINPGISIWVYTGYTLEELLNLYEIDLEKVSSVNVTDLDESIELIIILHSIDILVDGRFLENKKSLKLKFRGSSNQRLIDMKETLKKKEVVLSDMM